MLAVQLLPAGEDSDGMRARQRRESAAGHEFRVSPSLRGWEEGDVSAEDQEEARPEFTANHGDW